MRIDAHQHFWRYRAADYPWMSASMEALKRDWLPRDLRPLLDAHRFDACIAVQARATEAETDFLLDLADRYDWIAGVIGWVDLAADDLERPLARWQGHQKLAGFRHQVQDEEDATEFLSNPCFLRGVTRLQAAQRVYEVLVFTHQLEAAAAFCGACERHWLVLDHLGKPAIRDRDHDCWRRRILPFRDMPHVLCKLSGLVTEAVAPDGAFEESEIRRYLDTALEVFGVKRLLYGSDWPVCLLAAPYGAVYEIVQLWAARLSPDEQAAVFGETAARCYATAPAPRVHDVRGAVLWT